MWEQKPIVFEHQGSKMHLIVSSKFFLARLCGWRLVTRLDSRCGVLPVTGAGGQCGLAAASPCFCCARCLSPDSDTTIVGISDKQHTVLFVRLGWESGVILLYLLCMMLWLVTGGQVVTRTQDSAHWAQPFTGHSQETPLQLTGAAPGPA